MLIPLYWVNGKKYKVPHCGDFSTSHYYPVGQKYSLQAPVFKYPQRAHTRIQIPYTFSITQFFEEPRPLSNRGFFTQYNSVNLFFTRDRLMGDKYITLMQIHLDKNYQDVNTVIIQLRCLLFSGVRLYIEPEISESELTAIDLEGQICMGDRSLLN